MSTSADSQGQSNTGYSVVSPLGSKISAPSGWNLPSVAALIERSFCVSGG